MGVALFVALVAVPSIGLAAPFATIQGTVVDSGGHPLSAINVIATPLAGGLSGAGLTDSVGSYSIEVLTDVGYYTVDATDPNGTYLGESTAIPEVVAGPNTANFILLKPGMFAGTVTNAITAAPVAGIQVQSTFVVGDFEYLDNTAVTGPDGAYTITNAHPGVHVVYFYDGAAVTPYDPQWYDGKLTRATATLVIVNEDETTPGIDAALTGGAGVTVIAGRVTAVNGDPLPGTTVKLWNATSAAQIASIGAGPDGSYAFGELPVGDYKVSFEKSGYVEQYFDNVGTFAAADVLAATGGGSLTADAVLSKLSFTISGKITDADGNDAAGVTVNVISHDTSEVAGTATTDNAGSYTVGSLPAGHYVVQLHKEGITGYVTTEGRMWVTSIYAHAKVFVISDALDPLTVDARLAVVPVASATSLSASWRGIGSTEIHPAYGGAVYLEGHLLSAEGADLASGAVVAVQRLVDGAWVTWAQAVRSSSGLYTHRINSPASLSYWRLSYAGDALNGPSVSETMSIKPLVKIYLSSVSHSYRHTTTYTLRGRIFPTHAAGSTHTAYVRLYRYSRGAYRYYKTVRATIGSAGTTFSARIRLPYVGRWKLVPYARTDSMHYSTTGPARYAHGRER